MSVGFQIKIDKDELYEEYVVKNKSMEEVAKHLHCGRWVIKDRIKKFKFPIHKNMNYYELTQKQLEVLNGAMLGDGHMECFRNASLQYTSKSKQHVEFVGKFFQEILYKEKIKAHSIFDKRTNKTYTNWTFRTKSITGMTEQYTKWYKNKEKILPNDLKLTPLTMLIWYIGDGTLLKQKRTQCIKLATQCFSKQQIEQILLPQMCDFHPKLYKAEKNKLQFFIYIPRKYIKKFLNYIGDCPFDDYKYKWDYIEYKNKMSNTSYTIYEQEFCNMYLEGKTYYGIAKIFGVQPNVVKYYLVKNNIYKSKERT